MKLKMFRSLAPIWSLRDNAEDNIPLYLSGHFNDLFMNEYLIELDVDFAEADFDLLRHGTDVEHDIENAMIIYEKFNISPRLAREQRLWTYIAHTAGLEYAKSRWPFPKNAKDEQSLTKAMVNHIRNHFVTQNNKRAIDRDNAISRLWMSAYISDQVEGLDLQQSLQVLLKTTDFRENVVGRPTIIKCPKLLNAIIHYAKGRIDDNDDEFFDRKPGYYRMWLEKINFEGGITLFDALGQEDVKKLIEAYAADIRKS